MLELGDIPRAAGADPAARRAHRPKAARERFVADSQSSKRQVGEALEALEQVVAGRKGGDPSRSYTAKLLAGGPAAAGAKVTEEAAGPGRAAGDEADEGVGSEAADLLYHMLVLLACRDVSLERVEGELARRFGVSGLAEKAARGGGGTR